MPLLDCSALHPVKLVIISKEMEYAINGIIVLSPGSELRLSSEVNFIAPSKASVVLSSMSDDKLSVLIKLEADSDTSAQELAQLELTRICNVMSFYRNISISKCGVTGMRYTKTTSKGNTDVVVMVKVGLHATASAVVTLGNKSLATLVSNLKQDYSVDCAEVISIWREAFSRESSVERFFSLYRLMEYLFCDTESIDEWIRRKDSSVQLFAQNKYRKYDHTIYTYLRDNIHYKKERILFPIKEIQDNLQQFQTLVQQAIKEKFSI
jgi:hypothetical protein